MIVADVNRAWFRSLDRLDQVLGAAGTARCYAVISKLAELGGAHVAIPSSRRRHSRCRHVLADPRLRTGAARGSGHHARGQRHRHARRAATAAAAEVQGRRVRERQGDDGRQGDRADAAGRQGGGHGARALLADDHRGPGQVHDRPRRRQDRARRREGQDEARRADRDPHPERDRRRARDGGGGGDRGSGGGGVPRVPARGRGGCPPFCTVPTSTPTPTGLTNAFVTIDRNVTLPDAAAAAQLNLPVLAQDNLATISGTVNWGNLTPVAPAPPENGPYGRIIGVIVNQASGNTTPMLDGQGTLNLLSGNGLLEVSNSTLNANGPPVHVPGTIPQQARPPGGAT